MLLSFLVSVNYFWRSCQLISGRARLHSLNCIGVHWHVLLGLFRHHLHLGSNFHPLSVLLLSLSHLLGWLDVLHVSVIRISLLLLGHCRDFTPTWLVLDSFYLTLDLHMMDRGSRFFHLFPIRCWSRISVLRASFSNFSFEYFLIRLCFINVVFHVKVMLFPEFIDFICWISQQPIIPLVYLEIVPHLLLFKWVSDFRTHRRILVSRHRALVAFVKVHMRAFSWANTASSLGLTHMLFQHLLQPYHWWWLLVLLREVA